MNPFVKSIGLIGRAGHTRAVISQTRDMTYSSQFYIQLLPRSLTLFIAENPTDDGEQDDLPQKKSNKNQLGDVHPPERPFCTICFDSGSLIKCHKCNRSVCVTDSNKVTGCVVIATVSKKDKEGKPLPFSCPACYLNAKDPIPVRVINCRY
jgi:hypothetical protein